MSTPIVIIGYVNQRNVPIVESLLIPHVELGCLGLTSALLLSRKENHQVTVIAEFMLGDYNAEYASPWADANFIPCVPVTTNKYLPTDNPQTSLRR